MNRRPREARRDPLKRQELQTAWATAQTIALSNLKEAVLKLHITLEKVRTKHNELCERLDDDRMKLSKRLHDHFTAAQHLDDEIAQRLERQEQYLEEVRQRLGLTAAETKRREVKMTNLQGLLAEARAESK